jgi:hypothetical protein
MGDVVDDAHQAGNEFRRFDTPDRIDRAMRVVNCSLRFAVLGLVVQRGAQRVHQIGARSVSVARYRMLGGSLENLIFRSRDGERAIALAWKLATVDHFSD